MKKQLNPFFLVLMGLSILGFVYLLITDTKGLLLNIVAIAVIALIFLGIYKYLSTKEKTAHRSHHYTNNQMRFSKDSSAIRDRARGNKTKQKEYPFKVIEGSKGKKKKQNLS